MYSNVCMNNIFQTSDVRFDINTNHDLKESYIIRFDRFDAELLIISVIQHA